MISSSTKFLHVVAQRSLSLPVFRVMGILALNCLFITKTTKNLFEKYIYNPYYSPSTDHANIQSQIKIISDRIGDIQGKIILELGPGGDYSLACYLLAAGVKQVILLDNENHIFPEAKDLQRYAAIFPAVLDASGQLDTTKITNISYVGNDRIPLADNTVDIIYSMAVLEHVTHARALLAETVRILKPGSKAYHQIDFRDHIYKQSSLFFLSIPPWLFNLLFSNTGMWTNRIRYSKWKHIFNLNGFKIMAEWPNGDNTIIEIPNRPTTLSQEDIQTTSAAFLVQK